MIEPIMYFGLGVLIASLIALVTMSRRGRPPSWWQAVLVGVLLGATAISRES